jgi:hypothetical protein
MSCQAAPPAVWQPRHSLKKPGGEAAGNAAIQHTFRPAGVVPPLLPRRRRRIQASLQMLPNSVQQGACARKYIAAFCELPLIIEYTINQILSTKIFRGNRKARLKPRPSSGMLPSEPCPPNGGHGAAAHLLPRTYRCRGLPQKNQSDLTQTARKPRAVFPYYCLFGCSICIYFKEVYADNPDSSLFFCT